MTKSKNSFCAAGKSAVVKHPKAAAPKITPAVAAVISAVLAYPSVGAAAVDACSSLGGVMKDGVCVVSSTSMSSGTSGTANTNVYLTTPITITDDLLVQGVKKWTAQFVVADGTTNTFTLQGSDAQFKGGTEEGAIGVYAIASGGGNGTLTLANSTLTLDGYAGFDEHGTGLEFDELNQAFGLAYLATGAGSTGTLDVTGGSKIDIQYGGLAALASNGATAIVNVYQDAKMTTPTSEDVVGSFEVLDEKGWPLLFLTDSSSKATINNYGLIDLTSTFIGNVEILNSGNSAQLSLRGYGFGSYVEKDDISIVNENGAQAIVAFDGRFVGTNKKDSYLEILNRSEASDVAETPSFVESIENYGKCIVNNSIINGYFYDNKTSLIRNYDGGELTINRYILYGTTKTNTVQVFNTGKINVNSTFIMTPYRQYYKNNMEVDLNNKSGGELYITKSTKNLIEGSGQLKIENEGSVYFEKGAGTQFIYTNSGAIDDSAWVSYQNSGTTTLYADTMFELTETGGIGAVPVEIAVMDPGTSTWSNKTVTIDGFETNTKTVGWELKDDWIKYSTWIGGNLYVEDVQAGTKAAQQMQAAFEDAFGNRTTIQFEGSDDWASEGIVDPAGSTAKFDASVAQKVLNAGYAGAVVQNFDLENAAADGSAQPLTIGTGSAGSVLTDSIGFRGIKGVSAVSVNSGKYLALVGSQGGAQLVDQNTSITLDNGTLMLGITQNGSARSDASTSGTLGAVIMSNGANVVADNMWVQADSVKGSGTVKLSETGRMHVKDLTIAGNIENAGTLSADNLTISKGTAKSSKMLKSSGKLTVESTATLATNGILAADTFDIKGVVKLGKNAKVYSGAALMDQIRQDDAEAAAELDRVEGKAGVSTMSIRERNAGEPAKASAQSNDADHGNGSIDAAASSDEASGDPILLAGNNVARRSQLSDAQAFVAFDAVNRIAADIEAGTTLDQHGLWVKLQTNEGRFGVANGGSTIDVDSDGVIVGAEAQVSQNSKLGAAFSYLDGEIDASGLKNNWESWGLHLYGAYQADSFALKGTAGYLRGTTEAARDLDADVWHAGVRAEYAVPFGSMSVTPFMGARVISGSFDGLDSQTAFSAPIGAKIAGQLSAGGWTIVPAIEAAYVRSMGDTDAEDLRFLPRDSLHGSIGVKAEKGMWTGELAYVGATGANDYRSNSLNVKLGLRF